MLWASKHRQPHGKCYCSAGWRLGLWLCPGIFLYQCASPSVSPIRFQLPGHLSVSLVAIWVPDTFSLPLLLPLLFSNFRSTIERPKWQSSSTGAKPHIFIYLYSHQTFTGYLIYAKHTPTCWHKSVKKDRWKCLSLGSLPLARSQQVTTCGTWARNHP